MKIFIENNENPQQCMEAITHLEETKHSKDDIFFDFSKIRFSTPFSMMFTGGYIKQYVNDRKLLGLSTYASGISSTPAHSYMKHVGFFDFIGLPFGKHIGQASNSATCAPIKELTHKNIKAHTSLPYKKARHVIHDESLKLTKLFFSNIDNTSYVNALTFSFREIIRNVFEHSKSCSCFIFGQKIKNFVEVVIIDNGVGIRKSLSENYTKLDSDELALKTAILPARSRIVDFEINNYNDNSGFGLYLLSRIGSEYGWFSLCSGQAGITISDSNQIYSSSCFHGTCVSLRLSDLPADFDLVFDEIKKDGEYEARLEGFSTAASASSSLFY